MPSSSAVEPTNHPRDAHFESALTSADSGLQ